MRKVTTKTEKFEGCKFPVLGTFEDLWIVERPRRSGTSSQVIIFRVRYSLNFRPISHCREQAIGSKYRQRR